MKTFSFRPHPAADLFPMMDEAALAELAADIKAHGQLHPIIVTTDDLVLDGRNRLAACKLAGVEPDVLLWDREDDGMSPTEWVIAANLHRRHLTRDQRVAISLDAMAMIEKELASAQTDAKERMREGGRKKGSARGATLKRGKAAEIAAKSLGLAPRTVERAKRVKSERPDLYAQVRSDDLTLKQAEKMIVRERQVEQVLVYRPPKGSYSVIVTDVSWEYDDQLDGSDGARGGVDYPPMPLEEILAMKIPAAVDCALWFWVTNAFLIDGTATKVLEFWGFTPKGLLTWVKDRWGGGHYLRGQTEHCLLAVRGKPVINGANQATFFNAPRTNRHSEKPAAFFKIAEQVTPCAPEARIELFARAPRDGWAQSGAELPKPPKKVRKLETMVSESKSKVELDELLRKWKASNVAVGGSEFEAIAYFAIGGWHVKFRMPMPTPAEAQKHAKRKGSYYGPTDTQKAAWIEQERRRRRRRSWAKR